MSFDHPWAAAGALLPLGWAAWEWRAIGAAPGAGAEGGDLRLHRARAERSARHGLPDQGRGGGAGRHVGQRFGGRSGDANRRSPAKWSARADGIGRASFRSPAARASPRWTRRPRTAGICATPPGTAGRGTDLEAAIRDGAAALPAGHGAAPAADLRRQRESGQRGARHLAGAATRHAHRYRAARRPSQARLRLESRHHSRAGIQRRAFPHRCRGGSAAMPRTPRWN